MISILKKSCSLQKCIPLNIHLTLYIHRIFIITNSLLSTNTIGGMLNILCVLTDLVLSVEKGIIFKNWKTEKLNNFQKPHSEWYSHASNSGLFNFKDFYLSRFKSC